VAENNAFVVYNQPERIKFRGTASLIFTLNRHIDLSVMYRYYSREYDYYSYPQRYRHSPYGDPHLILYQPKHIRRTQMETVKYLTRMSVFIALLLTVTENGFAQDFKKTQDAFISSYALENRKEYAKAVEALKKVYDAQSYEINVRLGWLCYYAGNYPASISYYSKAIQLKPYSVEARFGYALPASALGNWNQYWRSIPRY
jgi:tetratricopeptide (TPR) repeat protein